MSTGPRLRTALDPRTLVPPERDAVTGRLAAHTRQHKDETRRVPKRPHRHLLRTPAGIAGAALVAAGAIVGVSVAATSGSDDAPASPRGQVTAPGVLAPPAGTSNGQPPPACEIVTAAEASQIMGEPMKTLAEQTNNSCTYWSAGQPAKDTFGVSWGYFTDLGTFRTQLADNGRAVHDVPELGTDAFGYPSDTKVTGPGSREWTPAGMHFVRDGIAYSVALGRTDGESRAVDPAGDEQLALAVAKQLLSDLESGAIEVS